MRVFVLNATGQNQVLTYRLDFMTDEKGNRLPGNSKPYRQLPVPARAQMQFGGDWDPVQAQQIIQQLESPASGGVHVSDIRTAKAKGVVRLVWQQDKTILRPICDDVFQHNVQYLAHEGERRRKQMALGNNATADAAVGDMASAFAIEVETIDPASDSVAPTLTAGYRVDRSGAKMAAASRRSS